MKGIILHGGHGTRLKPLTDSGPKQLIPIANKPMSQYALEDLKNLGITEIAIIIGDVFPEKVRDYYGDGSKFGVNITYVYQEEPKGISHAISLCKEFVDNDRFVVYLGDNILRKGLGNLRTTFEESDYESLILLVEVDNPSSFGIAELKEDKLVNIVEKPKDPKSNLAVIGIYFFTPLIFEIIEKLKPSWRGELEVTDALQLLLESGKKIGFEMVTGWWKDTGTPDDILDAHKLILDTLGISTKLISEQEMDKKNKIIIGKNVSISSESEIIGPVILGNNCTIGSNVKLGPYVSLGNNCSIENFSIKNCIVMNQCQMSGNNSLTNSIIGTNSKINQKLLESSVILAENSFL